jgi:hypothetical protein
VGHPQASNVRRRQEAVTSRGGGGISKKIFLGNSISSVIPYTMKIKTLKSAIVGVCLLNFTLSSLANADLPLGGLRLLEGYEHQAEQGIDSKVGVIRKMGGLEIKYEIGRLPRPGLPRLGGQFINRPKSTPKDQLRWHHEQIINGQSVEVAQRKDDVLLVSFPQSGINFWVAVDSPSAMAEALLMILTYPDNPKPG